MSGVDLDNLRDIFAPLFSEELRRAKERAGQAAGQKTGFLEEAPGVKSVKRLVFFTAFIFGVAMCGVGFFIPISEPVKELAITIVTAAFGMMGVGVLAEAWESKRQGNGDAE